MGKRNIIEAEGNRRRRRGGGWLKMCCHHDLTDTRRNRRPCPDHVNHDMSINRN